MSVVKMEPDLNRLSVGDEDRRRLAFLIAAHGLTAVERFNRLISGVRSETSAEHSWHLVLGAYVLKDYAGPSVAMERVVQMLAIHDIVEVDAGDVPIYDEAARAAVVEAEERAARRLFGLLPADAGAEYLALWEEFEAAESDDARFARALDRLQPVLLHWAGGGVTWQSRSVTRAQEDNLLAQIEGFWPPLLGLATALIDDATDQGVLKVD